MCVTPTYFNQIICYQHHLPTALFALQQRLDTPLHVAFPPSQHDTKTMRRCVCARVSLPISRSNREVHISKSTSNHMQSTWVPQFTANLQKFTEIYAAFCAIYKHLRNLQRKLHSAPGTPPPT